MQECNFSTRIWYAIDFSHTKCLKQQSKLPTSSHLVLPLYSLHSCHIHPCFYRDQSWDIQHHWCNFHVQEDNCSYSANQKLYNLIILIVNQLQSDLSLFQLNPSHIGGRSEMQPSTFEIPCT